MLVWWKSVMDVVDTLRVKQDDERNGRKSYQKKKPKKIAVALSFSRFLECNVEKKPKKKKIQKIMCLAASSAYRSQHPLTPPPSPSFKIKKYGSHFEF